MKQTEELLHQLDSWLSVLESDIREAHVTNNEIREVLEHYESTLPEAEPDA